MENTLFSLSEGIRRCTACPLWKKRFLAVPGEGPENAKIMFVGEAPGAEEDKQGVPFVGPAGKFLNQLLEKNGIQRKDVFLTGAVKCHPEKNRFPSQEELDTCRELWLKKQIEAVNPPLIVILGAAALSSLLGEKEVGKWRGKIVEKDGRSYFITYHPSAGRRFPKIRKMMEEDFVMVKKLGKK
ncbi:MAG: uracil-DNA glycosylase [Nanoarchaeota archaeon]